MKREPKTEVNVELLKGIITAKKMKYCDVYKALRLTKRQWENRLSNKQFSTDEIAELIELLEIDTLEQVGAIFFALKDTQEVSEG